MPKLLYTWYFEKFTASVTSSGHSALRHEVSKMCTILNMPVMCFVNDRCTFSSFLTNCNDLGFHSWHAYLRIGRTIDLNRVNIVVLSRVVNVRNIQPTRLEQVLPFCQYEH